MNIKKKVEKYRIELRKKEIKQRLILARKKLCKIYTIYSLEKFEKIIKNLSKLKKKKKSLLPPLIEFRKMTISQNFIIDEKYITNSHIIFLIEEIVLENKKDDKILEEITWILINLFYHEKFLKKYYKDFIITFNSIIPISNFEVINNIICCLNNILEFDESINYIFENFEIEKLKDRIFLNKILNPKLGFDICELIHYILKKKNFFGDLEKVNKFFDCVVVIFDIFINKYYNYSNLKVFMKFFCFFFKRKEIQTYRFLIEEFISNDNFENFFNYIEISVDNNLHGISNLLKFFNYFICDILDEEFRMDFFLKYKKEFSSFVNFFDIKKNNRILAQLITFFGNLMNLHHTKIKGLNIIHFYEDNKIFLKIEDLIFEKNRYCLKECIDFIEESLLMMNSDQIFCFFEKKKNLIENLFELLVHENNEINQCCFNIIRINIENHRNKEEFVDLIKNNSRYQGDLEEFEKNELLNQEIKDFINIIKYDEKE